MFIEQIAKLIVGETVTFKARGNSMTPRIRNGDLVTLEPCVMENVKKGDIVLASVKGNNYVHLVKQKRGKEVLIANNHGHVNGWSRHVYGRVINIQNR